MNYRKEKQPPRRERQSVERATLSEQKKERRLLLVVTNGKKTEPNYFNDIKVAYSNRQMEVWFFFHFPQGRAVDESLQQGKTIEKLNECLFSVGFQVLEILKTLLRERSQEKRPNSTFDVTY